MNQKTTTVKHTPFFDIVTPSEVDLSDYDGVLIDVGITTTNLMFLCPKTCYVQATKGIVSLITSLSLEISQVNYYMLHGLVAMKPNVFFNCLAVSSDCQYMLYTPKQCKVLAHYMDSRLNIQKFTETFFIPTIYAFYRQEKQGSYYYPNESHSYCELTIVDFGEIETTVDNQTYVLKENMAVFYGPSQLHNQSIKAGQKCRYVTVMFEMNLVYPQLLNHVFYLNQPQLRLMEEILKITNSSDPLIEEMVVSKFKEFVLHCLIDEESSTKRITSMRVNYENSLLNEMIGFIHDNIYQSLQVSDLCKQFAVSRTVIQDLFNKYLSLSPKTYINQVKLNHSKMLINDSKYAISEISAILNYSSVHYFSRVFKNEFKISPTDYAKSILK